METRVLFAVMAVVMGFGTAFSGSRVVVAALRRHRAAASAQGEDQTFAGLAAWRLRKGFTLTNPLSKLLLKSKGVAQVAANLARVLSERGIATSEEPLVSVLLACLAGLGALMAILLGSLVAGAAVVVGGCAALVLYSSATKDKRREEMRDAIPDALESMSVCFGSGFTLLQTFAQVSEDVGGPLGAVFARCSHMLEMGSGARAALEELRTGAQASELAFVAVALDVQHQSGGAMRQVLGAATEAVKGELALRRSLRVQTAQAKLSARVVSVMPLILIMAFSLASPDFLLPFFSSPFGYALFALAVGMQAAGILLVRRALNVEGVS